MKKNIFLVLVVIVALFISNQLFASDIIAESKINEVTVYPDSALIGRVANIRLSAGENEILFSNIIPEIDENSLRVSSSITEGVKILGAKVKKEFLEEAPAERVKQLREDIQRLEDEVRRFEDTKKILAEEKAFLDSIRLFSGGQIPKDLVTKMPPAKDLDDTLRFLSTKLKENFTQVIETEMNIREVRKKIDVLKRELAQVSGPARKLRRSILVEVEALKSLNVDLSVYYLVHGASWQPIYDARAAFEKSEVELVSHAIVQQRTGEDWKDVELSLSTAKPMIGGRMSYVAPWILRPYQIPKRPLKTKMEHAFDTKQYEAYYREDKVFEEAIGGLEVESVVKEKGIAVVYKLLRKATVKSDGSEHKLSVSSQILKADFEYSTYPRVAPYAYLGSRVMNAKDLQLLAGRINIFLEGDYVGTSSIDNIGPGEEFDLYLGVDENVKIKREQIEKKVDETLVAGIPATTKRTTFKYKLSVENYKSKKINVKLFEAMPVSQDVRIKVKISNLSHEPIQKDWKDRKGIWLWELKLEPKGKQEIFYTFTIEHPREMQVEGL